MKTFSLIVLSISLTTICKAQFCKHAKVGMKDTELKKVAGLPDSTTVQTDNSDSLLVWHYGGQQAILRKGKIEKIILDPQKEDELSRQLMEGKLNSDDFEKQLEELNQNSCK